VWLWEEIQEVLRWRDGTLTVCYGAAGAKSLQSRNAIIAAVTLTAEGVLVDGAVNDQRRMTLVTVRTCLESGAAKRVAYEDPGSSARRDDTAGHALRRSVPTPGRNEPCPCGSRKKYQRCCGSVAIH
jgi:uncharacterized protein YchJ